MRETGIGFPDIKTLEPLSNALGISVFELLRSEKAEMEKKNQNFSEEEVTKLMADAVEMEKENRRQDKISVWLGGIVTLAAAAVIKWSGKANIGGALFLGALISFVVLGMYFFIRNKEDAESRKVYGFFVFAGLGIFLWLLGILGIDYRILAWGSYGIFGVLFWISNR